jgi:DNA polymerase-4
VENKENRVRKIIHVDMDAFYAAIEQRDNPSLKGKPIAVGGSPDGRGVVATASYEARKFGVHSAMSSRRAAQLCDHLMFVRPRFDVYKDVSNAIRSIFRRYTDIVEPLSLDEAYLDVTTDKMGVDSAIDVAKRIKEEIRNEVNLTASAGVSVNKFLAKIASDMNKPDGLTFIGPSKVIPFMESLPVEKFFGVGKVTAARMKKLGLHTGLDIKKLSEQQLTNHFGKAGKFYYRIVRGIDDRAVQPYRQVKSISAEDTFPYDLSDHEEIFDGLDRVTQILYERLQRKSQWGRTLTLKVKYHDFKQVTRRHTSDENFMTLESIQQTARRLMNALLEPGVRIRLLGIGLSGFEENDPVESGAQLDLDL